MNELQKRLIAIQNEIHAPKSEFNKFGGFAYRNAEAIYQSLKPLLKKFECALTLSDSIEAIGDRFYLKAIATISYGNESLSVSSYARESIDKKGMDSAQITGACSSYARKYALGGLFLIDDNKDFDAMDNSEYEPESQHNAIKEKASLALQVASELRRIGLSNSDIREYMAMREIKNSDTQALKELLANKDALIKNAKDFMALKEANNA